MPTAKGTWTLSSDESMPNRKHRNHHYTFNVDHKGFDLNGFIVHTDKHRGKRDKFRVYLDANENNRFDKRDLLIGRAGLKDQHSKDDVGELLEQGELGGIKLKLRELRTDPSKRGLGGFIEDVGKKVGDTVKDAGDKIEDGSKEVSKATKYVFDAAKYGADELVDAYDPLKSLVCDSLTGTKDQWSSYQDFKNDMHVTDAEAFLLEAFLVVVELPLGPMPIEWNPLLPSWDGAKTVVSLPDEAFKAGLGFLASDC